MGVNVRVLGDALSGGSTLTRDGIVCSCLLAADVFACFRFLIFTPPLCFCSLPPHPCCAFVSLSAGKRDGAEADACGELCDGASAGEYDSRQVTRRSDELGLFL